MDAWGLANGCLEAKARSRNICNKQEQDISELLALIGSSQVALTSLLGRDGSMADKRKQ